MLNLNTLVMDTCKELNVSDGHVGCSLIVINLQPDPDYTTFVTDLTPREELVLPVFVPIDPCSAEDVIVTLRRKLAEELGARADNILFVVVNKADGIHTYRTHCLNLSGSRYNWITDAEGKYRNAFERDLCRYKSHAEHADPNTADDEMFQSMCFDTQELILHANMMYWFA